MTGKARTWWIVGIVAVVIVAVVLVLFGIRSRTAEKKVAQPTPVPVPTAVPAATGIPSGVTLSTSDQFVRQVVAGLSSNPALVEWLANKDLIRRFVAAVALIADGKSPVSQISFLRPDTKFHVRKVGRHLVASPRSFHRYDLATDVFSSLDTAGTVKALNRLEPLIDEAYAQISRPGQKFQDTLKKAIIVLLKTPSVPANVPLKVKVLTYMYTDPKLEKLSPAQRLLLRTGPENVQKIQSKLRELATALGIPADQLPAPVVYQVPAKHHRSQR